MELTTAQDTARKRLAMLKAQEAEPDEQDETEDDGLSVFERLFVVRPSKPKPRIPFVQPEPSSEPRGADFRVTVRRDEIINHHRHISGGALPEPVWPRPGAVATEEEELAHARECDLVGDANRALGYLCWHFREVHAAANGNAFSKMTVDDVHHRETAEGYVNFLRGVWTARGIPIPTEDEFTAMGFEALRLENLAKQEYIDVNSGR